MSSRFSALVLCLGLLFPLEARVSVQPEYVDLKAVMSKSPIILVAKKTKSASNLFFKYDVLEILRGSDLGVAVGKSIDVYPANYDLHKDAGAARESGESAPIAILDVYKPMATTSGEEATGDAVLFLIRNQSGELQFSVEGAVEAVRQKSAVQKVMAEIGTKADPATVKALDKFDSLPQIIQEGEASDKRMEELRKQSKPFIEAIGYRNLVTCKSGAHEFTNIKFIINSGKKSIVGTTKRLEVSNAEIHEARDHGAKLSATLIQFLETI